MLKLQFVQYTAIVNLFCFTPKRNHSKYRKSSYRASRHMFFFLLHTDFDDIRVLHKHSFKIYEINIFFLLIHVSKKKMTPQKVKNDTHLNIN